MKNQKQIDFESQERTLEMAGYEFLDWVNEWLATPNIVIACKKGEHKRQEISKITVETRR